LVVVVQTIQEMLVVQAAVADKVVALQPQEAHQLRLEQVQLPFTVTLVGQPQTLRTL
jgi:hypothetical protein